jgi:hypothetical protein
VDRTATPIVFAFSHFPLLCSNNFWCNDGSGDAQRFRALYEPVFNAPATRVHIFLNGHVHAAEVNFPVATGSLLPSPLPCTWAALLSGGALASAHAAGVAVAGAVGGARAGALWWAEALW